MKNVFLWSADFLFKNKIFWNKMYQAINFGYFATIYGVSSFFIRKHFHLWIIYLFGKIYTVELRCVGRADGLLRNKRKSADQRNMRVFESYGYIKLKAKQKRPNIDFKLSKEAM